MILNGNCKIAPMKCFNLALAATILLTAALAAGQKKPAPPPKEIACPVMPTMKVNIASATKTKHYADYKGRRYFFCCDACPPIFKRNPEKFRKLPSIPVPKVKK